ncbi:hypothetical protein BDV95DRAFT_480117 [Massariosphaeria phaeospora]|uniref:SNF5-domain-containing protein n=1 Tax=Massariosphaeria phaeospora TaxID=100035 RepID=A0A7C8IR80_9PLEO|nr:hypothetical protein BDV95DRAFT_480117 [Massariosphaeria phaeospora]
MPSPVTSSTSSDPQSQPSDSSLLHDHGASPFSNGINGDGAVQLLDAPAHTNGPDHTADEHSYIREGKQKAKAVLAASGVNLEPDAGETSHTRSQMTSPAPAEVVNGASPSRKRSRSGSRKSIPTPSQEDADEEVNSVQSYHLNRYIERDLLASAALNDRYDHEKGMIDQLTEHANSYKYEIHPFQREHPGAIFGYGYAGYGNGVTDVRPSRLQYPMHSKRPGNRRARVLTVRKKDNAAQADQIEELVPVRLDIELDKIKLRDTFTWNLNDRFTDPSLFAETLAEDFQLPPESKQHVTQLINREIQEQIQDYYPHAFIKDDPLDPHLPYYAYKDDEMRVLIKLNITIGQHTLVDQFEWGINDSLNSPEEFARQMACDMSLSGEFTTAIAHSIREQCQMFTKSLYITGHPFDGRIVEDTDIRDNFLQSPLPQVFRPQQSAKDYQPYLYELSEIELERAELSIMREQRRQKRSVNRRGGPALPDLKDRQRTVRTLVVSSVLPGAAETIEESHLYKISRDPRKTRRRGNEEDSDDSDSDESVVDSPAPSQLVGGTARTRGMRGAATAAQAAMRSALGRSATPEISALQHHETRTTARQLRYDTREESVPEPTTLIVKLRISPNKFREYLRNPRAFARPTTTPVVPPTPPLPRSTSGLGAMPPPPSPAMQPRSTPTATTPLVEASPRAQATPNSTPQPQQQEQQVLEAQTSQQPQQQWQYYPDGKADAPWPVPPAAQQAPPPSWLRLALQELQTRYVNDKFEATMRYMVLDQATQQSIKLDTLQASATLPAGYKAQYLPRIRCNDCPGKLYTAGPEHTLENFEIHLKNRGHRTNVEKRTGRTST